MSAIVQVPFEEARPCIRTGDIGLLHATGRFGRWIRRIGGCDLVHALMFGWVRNDLFICEQVQPRGRIQLARDYFDGLPPDVCLVFRPKEVLGYDGEAAWEWMVRNVPGLPYPRRTILRSFLAKQPFLRWHVRASDDDEANGVEDLVCSGAIARAARLGGGVDLVPRLSDAWSEPIHLYHSAALDVLFSTGGSVT